MENVLQRVSNRLWQACVCTVFNIRCLDEIVQHLLRHDSSQYQSHLFDCIIFIEFELFPEKNNVIDIYGIYTVPLRYGPKNLAREEKENNHSHFTRSTRHHIACKRNVHPFLFIFYASSHLFINESSNMFHGCIWIITIIMINMRW